MQRNKASNLTNNQQRKTILDSAQTNILTRSRRRCCLCFWLDGLDEVVKGQICHLDKQRQNNSEDNLVFLCIGHHDEYDSIPRQSKAMRQEEVKHWRDELYREMAYRFRDHTAKQKKRAEEFEYLESMMADLFVALRSDLAKQPLARMIVFSDPNTELKALHLFLEYKTDRMPNLFEKGRILYNYGLLTCDADGFYWLTEELVKYLSST